MCRHVDGVEVRGSAPLDVTMTHGEDLARTGTGALLTVIRATLQRVVRLVQGGPVVDGVPKLNAAPQALSLALHRDAAQKLGFGPILNARLFQTPLPVGLIKVWAFVKMQGEGRVALGLIAAAVARLVIVLRGVLLILHVLE